MQSLLANWSDWTRTSSLSHELAWGEAAHSSQICEWHSRHCSEETHSAGVWALAVSSGVPMRAEKNQLASTRTMIPRAIRMPFLRPRVRMGSREEREDLAGSGEVRQSARGSVSGWLPTGSPRR